MRPAYEPVVLVEWKDFTAQYELVADGTLKEVACLTLQESVAR